ncbi:MAG: hypothetical protein ACYDDF_03725 [Thermoplasmatota archaeon]
MDPDDRTLAVGAPFLLLKGREQPAVTPTAHGVAMAMALRELNAGVNTAMRFAERPPAPPMPPESAASRAPVPGVPATRELEC